MVEGEYRSPRHCSQGGEGPATVAADYGVPVSALLELNPWLNRDMILAKGDVVVLPASHGLEGTIAAISDRRGGPQLLVYNVGEGSSKMLVSPQCSWASVAALSPNGGWLVVQGADGRIHVIDIRADSGRAITEPLDGFVSPKWSPGGDYIMYEVDSHTCIIGVESGREEQSFPGQFASWLGDGYRTVYAHLDTIVVRDMVDGSIVPLTGEPERTWGLAAASYGESVAYVASEGEGFVLRTVDVVTGEIWSSKVDSLVWPWSLAWSPNGKMIAYCAGGQHVDSGQLVKVVICEPGADGQRYESEVVSDPRFAGLAWSPDSRAVAVAVRIEGRGQYGVYAIEPGMGMFQLTGIGNSVFPDWGRRAD